MDTQQHETRSLEQVLHVLPQAAVVGKPKPTITGICRDSRQVHQGALFALMPGLNGSSERYCFDAINRGASAILTETALPTLPEHAAQVIVPNVRKAMAMLSNAWYNYPSADIHLIGITGTNGKTTTSYLVREILRLAEIPTGLIGTTGAFFDDIAIDTGFTTPEAPELCGILANMRNKGAKAVVMEVSSHALALDRVYGQRFAGTIFTNLSQDHLDFHGTMEEYAKAKRILFESMSIGGTAVINGDSEYGAFMESTCVASSIYSYGRKEGNDARIVAERYSSKETSFTVVLGKRFPPRKQDYFSVTTPLIGGFNVENATAAIVMALSLGVSAQKIQNALQIITGAPGRMRRYVLPNEAIAVVDYAHTPDALEKALSTCKKLLQDATSGRLIVVFGCGGDRDTTKRAPMGAIASQLADSVIITDDNPRSEEPEKIVQDIIKGISATDLARVQIIHHRREAIRAAVEDSQAGDIILIAGKGHETYQIIGGEKYHFDDAEEVQQAGGSTIFS